MDSNYVAKNVFHEYEKRMESEHDRQNHRLNELEDAVKQYGAITVSIERMAVSMEQMLAEQQRQGTRLEALEARDGEMWRKVAGYIITAIIGLVIGYLFNLFGGV